MVLVENTVDVAITDSLKKIVEEWRGREGNLIMVFHAIQKEYGYIPRNVAIHVSESLNVPLARIYEIITFYNYFNLEPPAANTVSVCMGTACYLKGAEDILVSFKKEMGIKGNSNYSEDRKYKIEEIRCIGCCGLAPVITFNGEIIGRVTLEDVPSIVVNKTK